MFLWVEVAGMMETVVSLPLHPGSIHEPTKNHDVLKSNCEFVHILSLVG